MRLINKVLMSKELEIPLAGSMEEVDALMHDAYLVYLSFQDQKRTSDAQAAKARGHR